MNQIIDNLRTTSGKTYRVVPLTTGVKQYVDRDYTIGELPTQLVGAWLIQTAGNDKMYEEHELCFTFHLCQPATVFILHGNTFPVRPAWLNAFQDTQENVFRPLEVDERNMSFRIFRREFPAEEVNIYGDLPKGFLTPPFRNNGGAGYCMFSVAVKASGY